jgi:hypothetical protein
MPPRSQKEKVKRQNKNPFKPLLKVRQWNRSHIFLLLLLTILGAYLRIEPAVFDTVHFSYDQGIDISYVRSLVVNHKLSLIGRFTGLEGVFMGPLWTWILTIPFILSKGSPTANVIFFSILGLLAIWVTYILTSRMLSESAALLTACYVAFSGAFISVSHIVLSPYPLTILMIFYLWFLWQIAENGYQRFWPWLGLLAGVFFQFEIGFAVFLIPATLAVLGVFGKLKAKYLFKKPAFLAFVLFIATFIPQLLFELRHNFLMTKAVIGFFSGENLSLGSEQTNILGRLFIRLGSLWEDYSSSIILGERNNLLAILLTIPAIFGWRKVKTKKDNSKLRFGLMLLILISVMYLGFSLFPGPVWFWYRAGLPIVFVLLIAIGWSQLIEKNKILNWLAVIALTSMVIFRVLPGTLIAKGIKAYEGGPATLGNQKQALDFIFQDTSNNPFDLYVYTPPVYTYVWDHMLFWYARPRYPNQPQDYGYQRSSNAENDFYLLIEPDEYQGRIDGWKGNFVAFGKPIAVWNLPGGMTIEKWKTNTQGQ